MKYLFFYQLFEYFFNLLKLTSPYIRLDNWNKISDKSDLIYYILRLSSIIDYVIIFDGI
jgi:hypothetical protein